MTHGAGVNVGHLLLQAATSFPHRPAISWRGVTTDYRTFHQRVLAFAAWLRVGRCGTERSSGAVPRQLPGSPRRDVRHVLRRVGGRAGERPADRRRAGVPDRRRRGVGHRHRRVACCRGSASVAGERVAVVVAGDDFDGVIAPFDAAVTGRPVSVDRSRRDRMDLLHVGHDRSTEGGDAVPRRPELRHGVVARRSHPARRVRRDPAQRTAEPWGGVPCAGRGGEGACTRSSPIRPASTRRPSSNSSARRASPTPGWFRPRS